MQTASLLLSKSTDVGAENDKQTTKPISQDIRARKVCHGHKAVVNNRTVFWGECVLCQSYASLDTKIGPNIVRAQALNLFRVACAPAGSHSTHLRCRSRERSRSLACLARRPQRRLRH